MSRKIIIRDEVKLDQGFGSGGVSLPIVVIDGLHYLKIYPGDMLVAEVKFVE
jgi:hypothetical protein